MASVKSTKKMKMTACSFLLSAGLLTSGQAIAMHDVQLSSDQQGWKLQVDGKDFFVKGVVWGYTPRNETYTYNLWGQPDEDIKAVLDYEFDLMQKAGINAIRTFMMIPPKWIEYVYKKYGIMTAVNPLMGRYGATINGTWVENTDYSDPATREVLKQEIIDVVKRFKDTPGVFMFALGNESNYGLSWASFEIENLPVGEQNRAKAEHLYSLFGEAIAEGKKIAPDLPFTIVNGDIQYLDLINKYGQNWDLLGTNAYRGDGFTSLWKDVKEQYGKPVLFFEFGADAFNAKEFREDERSQAEYLKSQWEEMYRKAYGNGEEGNAIGGFVFEWRDEWWKYKQTENLDKQDRNASWANGGYKYDYQEGENNMNEEWWGLNRLGKANRDGVSVAETRLALDVLTEVWKIDPYNLSQAKTTYSNIDMDALAEYRAENAERSDYLLGNDTFKMTGARIRAEAINKGLGGKISEEGIRDGSTNDAGVMGFADFEFEPNSKFRGGFTVNYIATAADSQFEYRYGDRIIDEDGPKAELYSFNATYNADDFDLDLFYHVPRYHWGYEGDFFGLVQEATDMTGPNGQDIWNAKAPYGFEFNGKNALKGFTLLAGPQVYWGANPKFIAKYRFGDQEQYAIIHSQDLKRSDTNDGNEATQRKLTQTTLQGEFDLNTATKLQLGAIVSGRDKIDEFYDYQENGTLKNDQVAFKDTLGVKAKLEHKLSDSAKIYFAGQYAGIVADGGAPLVEFGSNLPYSGMGNKVVAEAGAQLNFGNYMLFPRVFARNNLIDANLGTDIRDTDADPFAVLGNREVRAAELMLTYDPTPATPFYAWDNDMREDAKVAYNVGLTYMDFGTKTDAYRAFFDDDVFTGEAAFADGLEPDQLWMLSSKVVFNPSNHYRAVLRMNVGKEQSTGSPVDATSFKSVDAKLIYQNRHVMTAYAAKDKWGPYDFQRQFGIVYPEQYQLGYTYLLDKGVREEKSSKVGIKVFYRTLDEDSPEYAPNGLVNTTSENIYLNKDMYEIQTFVEYHF